MNTEVHKTEEKTFNKKVKARVKELMPEAKGYGKISVPGCGYVYYVKNGKGETIGNVSKELSGMEIRVKTLH